MENNMVKGLWYFQMAKKNRVYGLKERENVMLMCDKY
jgi:hypothetical protein